MKDGERQVATSLAQIRADHTERYFWASRQLESGQNVLDFGCGIGYGSHTLASAGVNVVGVDVDSEAVEYAREHWCHPRARFVCASDRSLPSMSGQFDLPSAYDAVVAFEVIEHIEDPLPLLQFAAAASPRLLVSVPNEDVFPYHRGILFHHRHYTRQQLTELLNSAGWEVESLWGQDGPHSPVTAGAHGRTLVAVCKRMRVSVDKPRGERGLSGKHVSILGLGPSLEEYSNITKRLGSRHKFCDETWAINAAGSVYQCDRVFHMDDVRVQEIRANARPDSNIAAMLPWLKSCKIPVVTSIPHPDYPATEAFPLAAVLNDFDSGYFNSTAAYAVAYAVWLGAARISLFGIDFTYPNSHTAEKGRACVEFWLGVACDRGCKVNVPKSSSLLDAMHKHSERFYGYDLVDVGIGRGSDGAISVELTEHGSLPTADEIEAAYDHERHPNRLVEEL